MGGARRLGWIGAVVLTVMTAACLLTLPWTMGRGSSGSVRQGPPRYEQRNLDAALLPPSWTPHRPDERERRERLETKGDVSFFVFGTDRLGRDVLIRALAGGGISLGIGIAAAAIAVSLGTLWGVSAGVKGGRVDAVLMRIVDILYGLPTILLVVLLAVAADGVIDRAADEVAQSGDAAPAWLAFVHTHTGLVNLVTLFVAIGGVSWLTMARVIRGQVLSLKGQPFMEATRAVGVPVLRVVRRHLLPNLVGPIVVYGTLTVPAAILSESFLSFLGIGVREPLPSWGNLTADGLSELNIVRSRWWLLLWPCLFIALTLISLNFVGEGLRARLDPRRRERRV